MPIRWRLTIFNALVIGGILLALGCALFFLLRDTILFSIENTARNRALAASRSITFDDGLEEEEGRLVLDGDLVDQLTLDGVFIIVRDGSGSIITQTVDLPAANREARDEVWRAALEAEKPAHGTLELSEKGSYYVYAALVKPYGGPARIVEAGKSYEPAEENVRKMALVLASGIGVAFLLSAAGAHLLARAALSPVSAVVRVAHRISEGDLSNRLPVAHPKDEIGELTATINAMLSRLEETLGRLEGTLASQRRFVADASHELRTPLTSINSYAQVLVEWGLSDPEIGPESALAIKIESERMKGLVENMLELARGEEGSELHLKDNDFAEVVEEAVESASATANGKVIIEHPALERGISAVFDSERLRQALSILLDNAVKYTPKGGRVTVRITEEEGAVGIEVSDTGIGISEEKIPHVFERFYRAEEARSTAGSGLGLAIARQIVEDQGGSLEVRSNIGEGSTFTIRIPRRTPLPGT